MNYTLDQYKRMAARFNKMSFYDKIKTVRENSNILTLASDGNWWGVKVKDEEIEEKLYEAVAGFQIENEWGSSEMHDLIRLLGMEDTDI